MTEQNRTEQNRTEQNRTEQNSKLIKSFNKNTYSQLQKKQLAIGVFLFVTFIILLLIITDKVLIVGDEMRFQSIQEAVDNASNGDIVIICPGIYEECVDASGKTINIIGTSKEECILQYPNGDYYFPPLEMGSGRLKNLTIHATSQEKNTESIAKAYAMHTDYGVSAENTFVIENVDFINDDYQVVGVGLRNNFTLKFINCRFICNGNNNAFYCHDDPTKEASINQKVIIDRCVFTNNGSASTILLQSQEMPNSKIVCTWKDNVVKNKSEGSQVQMIFWNDTLHGTKWLGTSYWENSNESKGNNVSILNNMLSN